MGEKKISKNNAVCGAVFVFYAVLTLIGALNHELWFDEAQAWTIARDNTISGIFRQLGYEGHPPLWYLILYIFSHLGFECTVIPLISWFITAAAAAVVMFKAPFHIVTKSAVLFSGGFLYFNSVMSRVYCLINLFAVLIAWLYPKRKEHPILFGLLIALLANTHICISGFIGIMGIFMITDLFRGFKTNSPRQNAAEIAGLAVSGAGVLLMVLPLLNSLSLNSSTSKNNYTFNVIVSSALESFSNISMSLIEYGDRNLFMYIISGTLAIIFIAEFILMRHKTRPFLVLLFFCIFYIITSGIFWYTIPNRAHIFILMFFITAWTAEYEPCNNAGRMWSEINTKIETRVIKKIIDFIRRSDEGFKRSFNIIMTLILIIPIPTGAYFLFRDYVKPFSPSETAAGYIKENFPENSVFITGDKIAPFLSAYLPEYNFYSLDYGEFYTYCCHKKLPENISYQKIYKDLKNCENIYFLNAYVEIDFIQSNRNIIYSIRDGIPFGVNIRYIEISEFDLEKEIGRLIPE